MPEHSSARPTQLKRKLFSFQPACLFLMNSHSLGLQYLQYAGNFIFKIVQEKYEVKRWEGAERDGQWSDEWHFRCRYFVRFWTKIPFISPQHGLGQRLSNLGVVGKQ